MNAKKLASNGAILAIPALIVASTFVFTGSSVERSGLSNTSEIWHRAANPGALSAAHTELERDCRSCHTPMKGVTPENCIACHANNSSLLQRRPTAFHSDISSCHECHIEHQGLAHRPLKMDHDALAKIGYRQLAESEGSDEMIGEILAALEYRFRMETLGDSGAHPSLSHRERALNCFACHDNDDRHFSLFGSDCASCHMSTSWTIPEFIHPAASSLDCAQCHQAPPSHYMMHFSMISQKVAQKPHAKVEQCHLCHQTTSWPDIVDVGWYKHH